ncbi:alpha/beta hydrolase [Oscillochloris sp. ZM17-4]|uniref:alpha/beta hydrolase n=1 Tax=Oscillochloris sp. ZM17-4 TaxID=2866714 RepID=UPI001C72A908|nr:alpha/beta hydrolase [Oscillochloris sp. ZM17-4]MBX0329071.1 alpha/beta hydrolase [Oscillochloris sp. ZM17-4]
MTATTRTPPAATWAPDALLPGFEALTLAFPDDYDGPVTATLVRRPAPAPAGRAVLYIHGFIDYFYQAHMADAYSAHGFSFYALDLRKSGRSMLPHQRPYFCRDLREHFAEIDAAIDLILADEGDVRLLLNGHSAGGLLAALYASEGARRGQIDAIFLNSPFFDFKVDPLTKAISPLLAALGGMLPNLNVGGLSPLYGQSIHRSGRGAWDFDLRLKPIMGPRPRLGWVRATYQAQRTVRAGLRIPQPILLMHAARSGGGAQWNESFTNSDCVLDVDDMRRYGPGLGDRVTMISVEGAMHDLVLSAPPVRARVFDALFAWAEATL